MTEWYKKDDDLVHEIETTQLAPDELAFWNLGQCGYAFKRDGRVFFIDPVLNDLLDAEGNTKRLYPAGFDPSRLKADAVFCTHAHRDHMSLPTLQALPQANPAVQFIVPAGTGKNLAKAGIPEENIVEARHQQPLEAAGLQVLPIRTAHPEWKVEPDGSENSLAWKISDGNLSLLHLGDTYLCPELAVDLEASGPVDILFAPINGQDYFRTARGCIGNLSPYEAARVSGLCQADLSIPTHYDMMKGNTCSPYPFMEEMDQVRPGAKAALPKLGERIIYKKEL